MAGKAFCGKKILVVTSDFIYPPNHGARVDIWNRIKCFYDMGFKIDIVYTTKKRPLVQYEKIVMKYVNRLILVYRKNKIFSILSIKPFSMKVREKIKKIKLKYEYDYVFIEGGTSTIILENKTLKYKHVILRVHNDDVVYYKQLMESENIWWRKLYYLIESYKYKYLEKYILKKISNFMFISYDEMQKYKRKYKDINACFLPSAVEFNFKKQSLNSKNVLIVCSLFMINNKEAIRFYIEKIHPLLCDIQDYNLIIAGNSRGEGIEWIKKISNQYNNIKIFDTPENLDAIYKMASVFVNPMLHGAGVKLKTINAIVNGLPVVSTYIGNEGTGLKNKIQIYVTNEIFQYVKYIRKLLDDKNERLRLVKNAQEYIQTNYNHEKILLKYFSNLDNNIK